MQQRQLTGEDQASGEELVAAWVKEFGQRPERETVSDAASVNQG